MFKLNQSPTYFWPVEVAIATDGGQFATETFDAQFRRVTQDELQAIADKVENGTITDQQIVRQVMTGWKGVTAEGSELTFGPTALDQLLAVPGVAKAVVLAFVDSCKGGRKAKN